MSSSLTSILGHFEEINSIIKFISNHSKVNPNRPNPQEKQWLFEAKVVKSEKTFKKSLLNQKVLERFAKKIPDLACICLRIQKKMVNNKARRVCK